MASGSERTSTFAGLAARLVGVTSPYPPRPPRAPADNQACDRLSKTFKSSRSQSLAYRMYNLKMLAFLLSENESKILDALKTDLGKEAFEARVSDVRKPSQQSRSQSWSHQAEVEARQQGDRDGDGDGDRDEHSNSNADARFCPSSARSNSRSGASPSGLRMNGPRVTARTCSSSCVRASSSSLRAFLLYVGQVSARLGRSPFR